MLHVGKKKVSFAPSFTCFLSFLHDIWQEKEILMFSLKALAELTNIY